MLARECIARSRPSLVLILVLGFIVGWNTAHSQSLRFYGNGVNDIDRVKIRIDDPASYTDPSPPADVGAADFTIEMWLKPTSDNAAAAIACGNNYNWILGNVVFDRDRYGQGRSFGISLGGGRVVFGVSTSSGDVRTICGSSDLRDGSWHHVAVQRRRSDGYLWLYVDGRLQAQAQGPAGDISYPDDGVPRSYCGSSGAQPCTNSDPFIVLGAEKHDVSRDYPSYRGWMDEVRISRVLRYSGNFTVPAQPFVLDSATATLYHFDEGTGNDIIDVNGNRSPGVRRYGGNPAGPVWASDTPFSGTAPGQVSFTAAAYSGTENGGSVTVIVSRSGGATGSASVDYSINNGSAVAGADFAATSGTLRWNAGESGQKSFTVALVNDTAAESSESATLLLTNAIGATLGSRTSATLSIADDDAGASSGSGVIDSFGRADSMTLGNGWIEKNSAAFSLVSGTAAKNATATDYRDNLVYRPAAENVANVDVTAEFRVTSSSPGYPMIVARLQNATTQSGFHGYLLAIFGSATNAVISRQNGTGWDTILGNISLSTALNTSGTYRLRLRVTGTTSVSISGYIERLNSGSWETIGSATVIDTSSSRISTAGSIGFSGDREAAYRFDNITRRAL